MKNSGINSTKFLGDSSVRIYVVVFVIIVLATGLLGIFSNRWCLLLGAIFYIAGLLAGLNAK